MDSVGGDEVGGGGLGGGEGGGKPGQPPPLHLLRSCCFSLVSVGQLNDSGHDVMNTNKGGYTEHVKAKQRVRMHKSECT